MDEILKSLQGISASKAKLLLDDKQSVDSKAGIIIEKLHVPLLKNEQGQEYELFAARVLPKSKNPQHFVNPHYHMHGKEPYYFLAGEKGEMNSGYVKENEVIWKDPKAVNAGDLYIVQENEVHSFVNDGETPYDFVFACPFAHLVDYDIKTHPEGDRYFTKDLKNGLPASLRKQ